MTETECVKLLVEWWNAQYPNDFGLGTTLIAEVPYPNTDRAKCDVVVQSQSGNKWGIEIKRIQFVGDNGKNNDFALAKTLSPYGKDRSLIHDARRLSNDLVANRKAVVAYGFEYDFATCDEAEMLHPTHLDRVRNIRQVCRSNDTKFGEYSLDPLIEMIDPYLRSHVAIAEFQQQSFSGLWAHPCGGRGRVFGWSLA